ncbi:MAG TPA: DUF4384 domain-containing protein [Blastocatellia bacterium]|nr:DUF4384 domain-containing protein [Blastocatellia bacterium]
MNIRIFSLIFTTAVSLPMALQTQGQQRNDDVVTRSFVITRGTEVVKKKPNPRTRPAGPIGIGYTVFIKGENGKPARVNPTREFQNGDKVRFVIESNTDGYLYIFHQENNGSPKMLFPDPRLKWGDNQIEAHKQYEAPSGQEPGDWWFNFVGPAATERFYLVVSRTRLPSVWSGERLVAHCRQNPKACPWRPADSTWKHLLAQATTETRESRSQSFGDAQNEIEQKTARRDVKLQPSDPAPAVIKINAAPAARMIMAMVEILHK